MNDLFSLKGKVAIVTGGGRGIGKGIAQGLARCGASIAVAARTGSQVRETAAELQNDFGVEAIGLTLDLREQSEIQEMVNRVSERFGRIDILVNNAGVNIRKMPQDYDVTEWDEVVNINLRSAFLCSQAVYPFMKAAGGGKIINTGSLASILAGALQAPYASSKGGIMQLSRSLAVAWAPDNIQINTILPGWIDTDLTKETRSQIPGLHEKVIERCPMKRWGKPLDFAGVAVFLAGNASDFITGVALPVDGGYSIVS